MVDCQHLSTCRNGPGFCGQCDNQNKLLVKRTRGTKTSKSAWKSQERKVAKDIDGVRVPMSGAGGIKGDAISKLLVCECKLSGKTVSGKKVYQLAEVDLKKNVEEAEAEGKLGFMVLRFKDSKTMWVVGGYETWVALVKLAGLSGTRVGSTFPTSSLTG
jgi:hypothetical protein